MTTDNPDLLNGLTIDGVLQHWFKYDRRSADPEFVLIMGTGVCGKTRYRHENYTISHVNVDAGDIFRRLEGDQILDFPGEHREVLDLIGVMIAKLAVRERHNIVTEVHYVENKVAFALIDAMKAAGYKVKVDYLKKELEESLRYNLARGPHNISSYRTDEFNVKWLFRAAAELPESEGRLADQKLAAAKCDTEARTRSCR